jgi:hypothetical protein
MRLIILAVLLSSCSMMHKASSMQRKDSTAVSVDQSRQTITTDSIATSTNKEIETSDLVVVLKDTATGFVSFKDGQFDLPASSIKEIRQKKAKQKDQKETTQLIKDQAIINDTRNTVTVKEKAVIKDKKTYRLNWMWIIVIIAAVLLYISRKKIYAVFKAFTI